MPYCHLVLVDGDRSACVRLVGIPLQYCSNMVTSWGNRKPNEDLLSYNFKKTMLNLNEESNIVALF